MRQEIRFRLILIIGILVLVCCVSVACMLLAIRIYGTGEIQVREIKREVQQEEAIHAQFEHTRGLNNDMYAMRRFYAKKLLLSDVIEDVANAMPSRVYLTSIVYAPVSEERRNEEGRARIVVTGVASTTEDILRFREFLGERAMFKHFQFPYSNLVSKEDVEFSFSFGIGDTNIQE
jgi:Tfp pilus assembly protein PilN